MLNRTEGFTLFELIITIAIVTIISFFAVPNFLEMKKEYKAQQTIKTLISTLNFAKSSAVTYKSNIVICAIDRNGICNTSLVNWNNGFIAFLDKNRNQILDNDEQILVSENFNFSEATTNIIWRASLGKTHIIFQSDTGLPRGYAGSFSYCDLKNNKNNKGVTLSLVGIVSLAPSKWC